MTSELLDFVAVYDGQCRWLADRSALLDAMREQEWFFSVLPYCNKFLEEPENHDPSPAYSELCVAVEPVKSSVILDLESIEDFWDIVPRMEWNPSENRWDCSSNFDFHC